VVGGTGLALGGCLGLGGDGGNSVEISDIDLINSAEQAQTADVTVEQGGDTVHDDTYELDVDQSITIDDLPEDSGEYLVRVELQDSDAEVFEQSPSGLTEADCISLDIEIFAGNPPTINQRATECGNESGNESDGSGNESGNGSG
jgi:hypothetical protein